MLGTIDLVAVASLFTLVGYHCLPLRVRAVAPALGPRLSNRDVIDAIQALAVLTIRP